MKALHLPAAYQEFLRIPAMSLGLYRHAVGEDIPQQPHTEDEVYYVIAGRGTIEVQGVDHAVEPGRLSTCPPVYRITFIRRPRRWRSWSSSRPPRGRYPEGVRSPRRDGRAV